MGSLYNPSIRNEDMRGKLSSKYSSHLKILIKGFPYQTFIECFSTVQFNMLSQEHLKQLKPIYTHDLNNQRTMSSTGKNLGYEMSSNKMPLAGRSHSTHRNDPILFTYRMRPLFV